MTDISYQKYFQLFSKSSPQLDCFRKCFWAHHWGSTKCSLTWQTKPITQSKHFILEVSVSTLPTDRIRLWIVGNRNDNGTSPTKDLRIIQREPEWTQTDLFQSEGSSHPEGQGDVGCNANNQGIRSRIRGQVANLLKKVQEGEITMKEAEQMVGLKTLKNHGTYKKLLKPQEQARSCIRS